MGTLYKRFDKVDAGLNRWLLLHSVTLLRISLGAVFLGFGILKFFPNVSPAQSIAIQTMAKLSFGLVPASISIVFVAALECLIGLCFITGRFLRIAVWLLLFELIGILSPVVLLPGELFTGPFHAPNLLGQYVLKDVILAAAGMVIASSLRKGRLDAKRTSDSPLRKGRLDAEQLFDVHALKESEWRLGTSWDFDDDAPTVRRPPLKEKVRS